jgi:hypothetical protein
MLKHTEEVAGENNDTAPASSHRRNATAHKQNAEVVTETAVAVVQDQTGTTTAGTQGQQTAKPRIWTGIWARIRTRKTELQETAAPSRTAYDLEEPQRTERLDGFKSACENMEQIRQSGYVNFDQQVLTLASAMLTLSIGFIKDVVPIGEAIGIWKLFLSWWLLGATVVSTLLSFITSRSSIDKQQKYAEEYYINLKDEYEGKKHWTTHATTLLNAATPTCFTLAIGLTLLFVTSNISHKRELVMKKNAASAKMHTTSEGTIAPSLRKVPKPGPPVPANSASNVNQAGTAKPANEATPKKGQ